MFIQALMEKAVVLGLGVSKQSASDALSALIVRYAELLAANGRLGMALDYLEMVPGAHESAKAGFQRPACRRQGQVASPHVWHACKHAALPTEAANLRRGCTALTTF